MNFRIPAAAGFTVLGLFATAAFAEDGVALSLSPSSLSVVSGTSADAVLASAISFDNLTAPLTGATNAAVSITSSIPNTFMGDTYVLATGNTSISGFDLAVFNNSGTSFTALQATIYIWGTVNTGTVSASAPAFSNPLGSIVATFTGGLASTNTTYTVLQTGIAGSPAITLNTPLAVPAGTLGITVNFQGSTDGVTFASFNNLTSVITNGVPATVGSDPTNGYYRNGNSEVNGNFTSGVRTLSGLTSQSIGMRIYSPVSAVPEPSTYLLMGLGVAGLLLRRRSQR